MLTFILVIWILSRVFSSRRYWRHYFRPFFGLGWGLPLLGLFLLGRRDHPYAGTRHYDSHGFGPEGFGEYHNGSHGFGGRNGWM